ncbi:MAG: ABC transporter substrate-binding protein, partial [Gemmatimonadales bacterium]
PSPRAVALLLDSALAACALAGSALACRSAGGAPVRLAVVDDGRDSVRLAAPAARIVSLNPVTTEILFAIGAGRRVVGRTASCDYPAEATRIPSVGGGFPPSVEAVLARRPDLVILYHNPGNAAAAARFAALGIAVLRIRTDHLADVPRAARLLGVLTGAGPAADSVARRFQLGLERERAVTGRGRPERPPVLILAWDQPVIALGAGSFLSELVELAGGRNIFADVPSPSVPATLEAIVARRPSAVITAGVATGTLTGRPEWRTVRAVRDRQLIPLTESVFNRPSPRAPEAIRALRRRLAAVR